MALIVFGLFSGCSSKNEETHLVIDQEETPNTHVLNKGCIYTEEEVLHEITVKGEKKIVEYAVSPKLKAVKGINKVDEDIVQIVNYIINNTSYDGSVEIVSDKILKDRILDGALKYKKGYNDGDKLFNEQFIQDKDIRIGMSARDKNFISVTVPYNKTNLTVITDGLKASFTEDSKTFLDSKVYTFYLSDRFNKDNSDLIVIRLNDNNRVIQLDYIIAKIAPKLYACYILEDDLIQGKALNIVVNNPWIAIQESVLIESVKSHDKQFDIKRIKELARGVREDYSKKYISELHALATLYYNSGE